MTLIDTLAQVPGTTEDVFEARDEESPDETLRGGADAAGAGAAAAQDPTSPIPGGGPLLEEPKASVVFRLTDKDVLAQERLAKNRDQEGVHWDRIRRGVQFSILEKSEDQSVYRAVLPPGVEDTQQPIPNKVLDLSDKQVSQILVDPPLPSPKPDSDGDKNRGAMDLAKRFLRGDGDASGTNDSELWRKALTLNRTRKSAFVFLWVDPMGAGWRPKQLMAHPQATDPAHPFDAPRLDETGQPVLDPQGQPVLDETADEVLRYVAQGQDGTQTFTQNPAEAAREWLPKMRAMVLHPNQVRTLPATANAFEAQEIILLMWEPLSEAKKRFPILKTLGTKQLQSLLRWRPRRWKSIVPEAQRPHGDELDGAGNVAGHALLFWYHRFCRIGPDYPDGGEIAVTGGAIANSDGDSAEGFILTRDTLREDIEQDDGTTVPVLMDPPIAQFVSIIDSEGGDPQGLAPVSKYGGANEIRAHLYMAALEDLDVRLHPNVYLTATSSVTKEEMNRRDGTPLEVMTREDMPIHEQRPDMPDLVPMIERVDHEMDSSANLNQTAQALDSSYSVSGEAKKVALRQAKVQLAQDWQGFINGCCQYWKCKLQLAQARLKAPMLVKLAGENTAYKAKYFVGADMLGISTVALQPGSGTMMSPAEKAQYLATFQGQEWLEKDQAGELARSSMSDDLGLPPSPHEEHIDRCIAKWVEGPPRGWMDAYAAVQAFATSQQQYQQALQGKQQQIGQTGQFHPDQVQALAAAQVGDAPVPPPQPMNPFEPRANDEEPVVARTQYQKLSKLLASLEYAEQPKPWRALVDEKYQAAAYAAGIVTMRQQADAQKAQAGSDPATQPPTYQQFLATVNQKVVAMAEQLFAREIAALGEAKDVAEKALPVPVPETIGPDPTHPLDLAHQSMEAERDRQHDITMAKLGHVHKQSATVVGKALDHATNVANEAALSPRPERA